MAEADPLVAAVVGAEHQEFAGMQIDVTQVGNARVKRIVYPPGARWSVDIKPLVGGERCQHAHVGFLAAGRLQGDYGDGCGFDFTAPAAVAIEPGHDAWVVGDEPTVLIQVDFEQETARRFGLPERHGH
jgi:hypothetical protein